MPWQDYGQCRGLNPNMMYPNQGGTVNRQVCDGCPVKEICTEVGLWEPYGVWGGMSVEERKDMREARGWPRVIPLPLVTSLDDLVSRSAVC